MAGRDPPSEADLGLTGKAQSRETCDVGIAVGACRRVQTKSCGAGGPLVVPGGHARHRTASSSARQREDRAPERAIRSRDPRAPPAGAPAGFACRRVACPRAPPRTAREVSRLSCCMRSALSAVLHAALRPRARGAAGPPLSSACSARRVPRVVHTFLENEEDAPDATLS